MNKRERLLSTLLDKDFSQEKAKILDTTVRFILSDMGKMYINFWNTEGPGVMVFQPKSQERSMFYWTLQEIHAAKDTCEQENNDDLAESLRRILESAQKIDPEASAGYIINDDDGIRYFQIDYNQLTEQ
jgi:hypothetical protein